MKAPDLVSLQEQSLKRPKTPDTKKHTGQWTRGMHVVDRRSRKKMGAAPSSQQIASPGVASIANPMESLVLGELTEEDCRDSPGDNCGWLDVRKGNQVCSLHEISIWSYEY